jgi:hypothetical protein
MELVQKYWEGQAGKRVLARPVKYCLGLWETDESNLTRDAVRYKVEGRENNCRKNKESIEAIGDNLGLIPGRGKALASVQTSLEAPQPPIQWVLVFFTCSKVRLGHDAERSPPSNA